MKKLMYLAIASAFMFACSNDDAPSPKGNNEVPEGSVYFDISAVNELSNGMNTRAGIYSEEATQHVERVNVYAFLNNGTDYVYTKTYTIPDWTDGLTFKRYVVGDGEKLDAGQYKFLAVGQDAKDKFNIIDPATAHTFGAMVATIQNSGDETEIFAGSASAEVMDKGGRVSIEMTRQVAGVLGYFKNIPQMLDTKTVKYLRLTASNSNQTVNLTTGTGVNSTVAEYQIFNMDLSGQTVANGIYEGNDLSGENVVKVANSQLSGAYFMPVSGVTLTLGLYDGSNAPIKTWVVKDSNGGSDTFDITANHFYALGKKLQAGNVTGGTGNPGDADDPIDLLTDQNIVITINPAWNLIHNLIIQ